MKILNFYILLTLFFSCFIVDATVEYIISELKWNDDGSKLVIAYSDGSFRILQTSDMSTLFHQPNPDSSISSFAWSIAGSKLAIGYYMDRVDIWDTINFQKTLSILTGENNNVVLNWVESDSALIVSDTGEFPTFKYDMSNGNLIEVYPINYNTLYLFNGNSIAIASKYYSVIFIDLNDMEIYDKIDFNQDFGFITSLRVSPNEQVVAIGFIDNQIRILNLQSREIVAVLDGGLATRGERGIVDLAFNETGTRLFTVTKRGLIRTWDTTTWQMLQSVELDTVIISSDFTPDINQIIYSDIEQGSQLLSQDLCDFVAPDVSSLLAILPQANTFNEDAQICLTENGTYTLTASLPNITGDVAIIGNGATITMTGGVQIFTVAETGGLTLKNITVSGGNAVQGGAIFNAGTLVLEDVILENNSATDGGAIYNTGSLTMRGGAIQSNTATNFGGGIYNVGEMDLDGVNIRDNDAVAGSGVYQGE